MQVSQDGSPTPRRALEPLADDPARAGGRFARADDGDTGSGTPRRLAPSPASPVSPVDPLEVPATTPVPPPAPVLPKPESSLPASAGRRFSASAEPSEFTSAAPRRSAVSPISPLPAIEPVLPPTPMPSAPPAGSSPTPFAPSAFRPITSPTPSSAPAEPPVAMLPPAATAPAVGAPTTEQPVVAPEETAASATAAPDAATPPAKPARSSRRALIVIASVLVVALLVAGAVWLLTLRSTVQTGGVTAPTTSALDPLVTAADLGALGGVSWVEATGTTDDVRPTCVPATAAGLPGAQRTNSRRTGAGEGAPESVVQVIDTYVDDAEASQAYAARLVQLGTCKETPAWITGANGVTGLADSAVAVRLVVQDQADQFHTLLISRTGRSVSMVDVTTTQAAVTALDLANVVGRALSRQCGGELGTCPGSVAVEASPPPTGDPAGWLVESDLPRVTPGSGRWGALDPFTTLDVSGSQCEGLTLASVSGTQSAGQRTLLLADDPNAPKGFGVDMVTYTFGAANAATTLANKLTKNISTCHDRAPTATIEEGPAVKGTGELDAKVSGSTFLVTQKTATSTAVYRVAVVTVGSKVVYLLGGPSSSFDFTDAQWKAIAVRAGQRASQA